MISSHPLSLLLFGQVLVNAMPLQGNDSEKNITSLGEVFVGVAGYNTSVENFHHLFLNFFIFRLFENPLTLNPNIALNPKP
jgi:hypothetical protein